MMKPTRQSSRQASRAAATKISAQVLRDEIPSSPPGQKVRDHSNPGRATRPVSKINPVRRPRSPSLSETEEDSVPERLTKKRKISSAPTRSAQLHLQEALFCPSAAADTLLRPGFQRHHAATYHRPLLLDPSQGKSSRASLLAWFDSVRAARNMPWRKPFIDPNSPHIDDPTALREALERRAYEVWISEIMLQQTRVAVVIDYWKRWMDRWPTIRELAAAEPDEVLAAWRGLGYYSRARRIHEAAKLVVNDTDMEGLLPSDPRVLEARVPGVGRYTAGAIASIVFGKEVPMVDGNVLRVLSRQLGVYANVKTDKAVIDLMWTAADALVKAVAADSRDSAVVPDDHVSDAPGRWGQALMELGSTVCTPKPVCGSCPISSTCRAYQEGFDLARKTPGTTIPDIEDACSLCETFEDATIDEDLEPLIDDPALSNRKTPPKRAKGKRKTESAYFSSPLSEGPTPTELATIVDHAKRFPLKIAKKAVREEETVVCAIRRQDGLYLLHRRPEKGLLANLWELPSHILPDTTNKPAGRKSAASKFASGLRENADSKVGAGVQMRHVRELGSVPWLFSHLKLTMHVHLFEAVSPDDADHSDADSGVSSRWRWADNGEIEAESMGTGMRKCWTLVQEAEG